MQPLTGTTGHKLRRFRKSITQRGERACSLLSGEFESFSCHLLGRLKGGVQHHIIHDRDPAHQEKWCATHHRTGRACHRAASPRSPDVDPLHYAVYDQAKKYLARERPQVATSWEKRVRGLMADVNSSDPGRLVAGYCAR